MQENREKEKTGERKVERTPSHSERKIATRGKDLYTDHVVRELPINIKYHYK
jgi:hypothetical protein